MNNLLKKREEMIRRNIELVCEERALADKIFALQQRLFKTRMAKAEIERDLDQANRAVFIARKAVRTTIPVLLAQGLESTARKIAEEWAIDFETFIVAEAAEAILEEMEQREEAAEEDDQRAEENK
jgi:hypothetical protein